MADYRTIRVPNPVFETLKDEKRDGETWGGYLMRLSEAGSVPTVRITTAQVEEIADRCGDQAAEKTAEILHNGH